MDLLGPSVEDLFNLCNRRFSLKTVIMLGRQMIKRLQMLHNSGYIHRDISPDNMLMGAGDQSHVVYLIDFGLSKRYRDVLTRRHIPYRRNRGLTGTARYFNASGGIEQSRRDDLESLGYILVYFAKGRLPWQGLVWTGYSKEEKLRKILHIKSSTSVETICKGLPEEFKSYLGYCRGLMFEERPDYDYLGELLSQLMSSLSLTDDSMYDWRTKRLPSIHSRSASQKESFV